MERIKQALDKARQERESHRDTAAPAAPRQAPPPATGQTMSQTVTPNSVAMRLNKLLPAIDDKAFSDAYSLLRTRILQTFKEHAWNTLAVTSPGADSGKTLTAINLAISIAREVDYTVLLVDANLGAPWLMENFGLSGLHGLSDHLADDVPIAELLVRPEGIDHLAILPGGRPLSNSAEMLNSPKMGKLVEEMKSRYHSRIIIFDLPPVLGTSDTLAFAPNVDAALLVVEDGKTEQQALEQTVELLSVTNIIGTVLNKASD